MSTTQPSEAVPSFAASAAASLLALAPLVAVSGVTRFEFSQAAALGMSLLVISGATFLGARSLDRGGALAIGALGVAAAWALGAAAVAGGSPAMLDAAAALVALLTAAWVVARAARREAVAQGLGAGASATLLATAAVGIGQHLGRPFPPAIPFVTDDDATRLLGDDPATGATLAAVLLVVLFAVRPTARRASGWVADGAAVAGAASIALTGQVGVGVALAVGVGVGVVIDLVATRRLGDGRAAMVLSAAIAAGGAFAMRPAADAHVPPPEFEYRAPMGAELGPAPVWDEPGAAAFWLDAGVNLALKNALWGVGRGGIAGNLASEHDPNSAYALRHHAGLPIATASPSALVDLMALWGFLAPLALLAGLLMAALGSVDRLRHSGEGHATAAGVTGAMALLVWSPGAGAVASMGLLGAAVGAGLSGGRHDAPGRARWAPLLLAGVVALQASWSVVWSYQQAAGNTWLGNARLPEAAVWYEHSASTQTRFETLYNRALLSTVPSGESPGDPAAVESALLDAIELLPRHARPRFVLANYILRNIGVLVEVPSQADEKRRAALALLEQVVEFEPSNSRALLMLAQIYAMEDREAEAVALLSEAGARELPQAVRVSLFFEAGTVQADLMNDPEAALASFRRALEVGGPAAAEQRLFSRISECEQWIATGLRPQHEPHGHETGPTDALRDALDDHGEHDEHGDEPRGPTGFPPLPPPPARTGSPEPVPGSGSP